MNFKKKFVNFRRFEPLWGHFEDKPTIISEITLANQGFAYTITGGFTCGSCCFIKEALLVEA